ncbi:MAG: HD domain-containing protein [Sedimentisphaerales bacterium]
MSEDKITREALRLGRARNFRKKHSLRVGRWAMRLFDELQPLHKMGNTERIWLWLAALLHDVGKSQDKRIHHKLARDIISDCSSLPFGKQQRRMIGLVARYHRGSFPHDSHKYYRSLDAESRLYVNRLASLLRLADGLDQLPRRSVADVTCLMGPDHAVLNLWGEGAIDIQMAQRKADLFEHTFGKTLCIRVQEDAPKYQPNLDTDAAAAYAVDSQ